MSTDTSPRSMPGTITTRPATNGPRSARGSSSRSCASRSSSSSSTTRSSTSRCPRSSASSAPPTSQLQWIVDAYTLVFAGLLLAAGSLGDRFGRKGALHGRPGLCSATFSVARPPSPTSPSQLIAARAAMGVGAALIFPATLAILANVFTDADERAKAIAHLGRRSAGLGVALGPVTGGWLLEHFWWGSVFLVNVPIVVVALVVDRLVRARPRRTRTIAALRPARHGAVDRRRRRCWCGPSSRARTTAGRRRPSLGAFALAAVLLGRFVAVGAAHRPPDARRRASSQPALHRRQRRRSRSPSSPCSASSSW